MIKKLTVSDENNGVQFIDSQKIKRSWTSKNDPLWQFEIREVVYGLDRGRFRIYFEKGEEVFALSKQMRNERGGANYRCFSDVDRAIFFLKKIGVTGGKGALRIHIPARKGKK